MSLPDPAALRRRIGRLQRQLGDRHVDDPLLQAALVELGAIADQLRREAGRLGDDQAAVVAERERQAEERSHASALFEVAPSACVVTDANGLIRRLNSAGADLFGGAHLAGRPLVLRFTSADRAGVHALATSVERGERPSGLVVTLDRVDPPRLVELRCADAGDGELLWLARDITRQEAVRTRLEEALERERTVIEQLRELDEVRNGFVLAVSHDLQAPLTAIAGLAGLLVERPRLAAADRRRMLEQIRTTSTRLIDEMRGLLDVERLHRGDVGLEPRATDLAALLRGAVAGVDVGDRSLCVDAEPVTAMVDPLIVRRIVDNLVANAVRHTPPGTTIWARLGREPDGLLLVIEDDGPGVPESLRSQVFELFTRDQQGASSGLGVGLALVRRFAELHGGSARFEPRPGGGASFHVLLAELERPAD